jgi:drug/metabolite transporter (DMT)-like permease
MLESLKIASDPPLAAIPPPGAKTVALPGGACTFGDASSHSTTLGVTAIVMAISLVVLNVAAMKTVSATMPASEMGGTRDFLACPLILALVLILGRPKPLARILNGITLLEVGFDALNAVMFLTALTLMSFASDSSIQQTVPLFMVVYACFTLGERLGWRQIAAIVVGFAGALFIAKPGLGSLGWGAVLAFGAATSLAARNWKARSIDPPILLLLATLSAGLVLGLGVAALSFWGDCATPRMPVRFEDSRGISSQDMRTVGRPMDVRLQLADGL